MFVNSNYSDPKRKNWRELRPMTLPLKSYSSRSLILNSILFTFRHLLLNLSPARVGELASGGDWFKLKLFVMTARFKLMG